jgi:PAS domain S-box-containing protein
MQASPPSAVATNTLERAPAGVLALADALARALTPTGVAEAVLGHLLPIVGAVAGTLVLRTEKGDALELIGARGYSEATLAAFERVPLHASTPAAEVVRTKQPLWIGSTAGTSEDFPYLGQRATDHKALAILPLLLEDQATGALVLAFAQERSFEPEDRLLLAAVAAQCAVALQRAEVFARERASRERLEVALRAANMGTWEWDLRNNLVAWSPELEAIHGFEPGAFGTTLDRYFAHLHPEDAERVRAAIAASLQTGELHLEYRGVRPDTEERWFEARGQLTRDSDGHAIALRGVCMDISARKRAEQALRESEERFRTLADNIAPFAWMADATGWIFWYNRRWYDYTGTTPEEMQGWGWTKVHHPDHVDRVVERIKRSWETGEPWEDTFPLRGRDGQYRWFLSRALPIRDEYGRVVRWLGTNTDITERRWTEALLAGERNALELIARGSPASAVLEELCRTVEGLAGEGLLASILLLDEDGVHLRHGAAPDLPDEYNRAIDGIEIGPSVGSCGTAAYRGEQVIVSDITTDPLWADYRHLALRHDLRACWSTPIKGIDGSLLGTFALYYHQPRAPTAEHLLLADLVGRTAATIIERKRADDTRARLVAIVDSSDDEITGKTLEGIVTTWNSAATRLYGYTAEERVGRPITEIIPADQLEEHSAIMARVARGERVPAWDTARLHKEGYPVEVSLSLSPVLDPNGNVTGISAIGRDVRRRRRLEAERDRLLAAEHSAREQAEAIGRRLAVQYELAELLAAAAPDAIPHVIPPVCKGLGWDWGALWRVDAEAGVLRCTEICQANPGDLDAFEAASRGLRFVRGEGLLGRVWESGEPVWTVNLAGESGFRRAAAAHRVGLRSGVILPLRARGEIVGVLSFHSREERPRDPEMLATLIGLGDQLGQFLERRRVEETLRRQSALLELAPVAVTVRDAQRRIIYWNPAAEALYGWTADQARGKISHDLLDTSFPMSFEAHEVALQRAGTWEGEVVRRRSDGQQVIVLSRWLLLRSESGDVQTLEVSTDITDRKQAEAARAQLYESEKAALAAAEAAIKARDDFVAVVSHDLRNPLAAVKAQVQMVRRRAARGEVPTAEQLVGRLDVVQSSITALSAQIDELHDATQLQAGRPLQLRKAPVDLVSLARECVIRHQHISDSHSVRFESAVQEVVGTWDAARLERVLANLLSNAIKYSPSGGEVVVEVQREVNWGILTVTDRGLGIPAADIPHVFERFRRASNVGRLIAGSGLGLAGARDIVEQHGGTISVTSEEGQGSTFLVRLPFGDQQ